MNNFAAQVFYIGSGMGPGPAPTAPKRAEFCAYSWVGGGLYVAPYETVRQTCMLKAAIFCSSQCYQHPIPAAEGNSLQRRPSIPLPRLRASGLDFTHKHKVRNHRSTKVGKDFWAQLSTGQPRVQQSWRETMRDIWSPYSLKHPNWCLQVAACPIPVMSKILKVLNCWCDISINNAEISRHFHIPPLMSECLWLNPSSLAFIAVCYTNKWD